MELKTPCFGLTLALPENDGAGLDKSIMTLLGILPFTTENPIVGSTKNDCR